ncbi:MAG: glycosyltransferase family 39 protein [Acidobacteriota bacterium]|nr:glycosyltransferase family 39 protein [Acidobacteriota bacterium]
MLAAVAVLLAASGGVRATVGGLRISARSPVPASVAALAAAGIWWLLARRARSVAADLDLTAAAVERRAPALVIAVAVASAAASAAFSTASAAGADASGYLSEAAQWTSGQLFYREPLAAIVGADDPWLTTPLGWRPGPIAGLQSPTYPPGLPLLMALPHAAGGATAAAWVVTLAAALAVWLTGVMATRFAGGMAGVIAAVAIATSPVFLFQSVQPMSDVPVTAAWMLTWVLLCLRGDKPAGGDKPLGLSFAAGIACAIAVLSRPNLAPLAAVPLFAIGMNARRLVAFAVPVAVAGLALMWLQWQWYGSPLRSGYGTADELFTLANIGANVTRYLSWLVTTSPFLLVAPAGIWLAWRQPPIKALAAFAALVVAAYLAYAVFDVWSYLRFLLPAMAVAAVFAAIAIAAAVRGLPAPMRVAASLVVILGMAAHGISQARALETFRLADQQRRVAQVAEFLLTTLPNDGVIVSGEQSGALRYYTGRSILRWDVASPGALAAALTAVIAANRPIVVALDAWESEPFRARLGALPAVSLEWPAVFEAGTSHRTRVWRLSDRDAFLRGERVSTERQP